MNELRQIGRAASGLALLALLAAALAFHAIHVEQHGGAMRGAVTSAGGMPVVTSVPDRDAGVQVGDVVEAIDGHPPRSLAQVEAAMASTHPAAFCVRRGGRELNVMLH
jgi:S1-C subfamily serine protease